MIPSHGHFLTVKSGCRSKAVSDGAVIRHVISPVIPRAYRFSYGTIVSQPFDPKNAKHKGQPISRDVDGKDGVDNLWYPIVKRVSWGTANK